MRFPAVLLLLALSPAAMCLEYQHIERPGQLVVRAEINAGMYDSCGTRETPHLIEHLLLSETEFGTTPADFVLSASRLGIQASAITRQDFTEFTLVGPAAAGESMEQLMAAILGRRELPTNSSEREVKAILRELGQQEDYRSEPHYFETFAANYGAPAPCPPDPQPLRLFSHAKTQEAYDRLYTQANINLVVVGPPSGLNLQRLVASIASARPVGSPIKRVASPAATAKTEPRTVEVAGNGEGVLEVLIALPGRDVLPSAVGKIIAERFKLAVQAALRKNADAYAVKSVLHQSNTAGWLSLSAPVKSALPDALLDSAIGSVISEAERLEEDRFLTRAAFTNIDIAESPELALMADALRENLYFKAISENSVTGSVKNMHSTGRGWPFASPGMLYALALSVSAFCLFLLLLPCRESLKLRWKPTK